jgi:hypothetical protein
LPANPTTGRRLGRDIANKLVPKTRLQAALQGASMRMLPYVPGKAAVLESIMKPIRLASNAIELGEPATAKV